MKENVRNLLKMYVEMLNKAEQRRAAALSVGAERANKEYENQISFYGQFVYDLCELVGAEMLYNIVECLYMGESVTYYKTVIKYNAE